MGKPCIVGCADIKIAPEAKQASVGNITIHEGDAITIDGSQGDVYTGEVPTIEPKITDDFRTILYWAQTNGALTFGLWEWAAVPGLLIALLGMSFALMNFAVDEITNPRLRKR